MCGEKKAGRENRVKRSGKRTLFVSISWGMGNGNVVCHGADQTYSVGSTQHFGGSPASVRESFLNPS